ncbi:MAG: TetR/AcrR family transcriptional regulator [Pseudomonadota bacterium]|nr:TetR/AcrR family transcriptional regulator [Pseudomonadota bacterium]
MPKLWSETIESHRHAVREAALDAAAALVAAHGLASVTMSHIAKMAGIGRGTLYKYFPDVESIHFAWHERQVSDHLQQLKAIRDGEGDVGERLKAVLGAYALISHAYHNTELAGPLHRSSHVSHAQKHLHSLISQLLAEGVKAGSIRKDVAPPQELATYCLHALTAASNLPSHAAVRRLVEIVLGGLAR